MHTDGTKHVKVKRTAVRMAPVLFTDAVHLVSFKDPVSGCLRYGHLLHTSKEDGTVTVLPEMCAKALTLNAGEAQVVTLVNSGTLPPIPVSAYAMVHPVKKSPSAPSTVVDFYTFSVPRGAPACVYIKYPADHADADSDSGSLLTVVQALVDPVVASVCALTLTAGDWQPCSHFLNDDGTVSANAVVAQFTEAGTPEVCRIAFMLAAKGFIVSTPSAVASSLPSPVSRVTSCTLKWIKYADCVSDLSAIVDQLPGLLYGTGRRSPCHEGALNTSSGVSIGCSDPGFTLGLYDNDFNVQRLMLCWGMLAAVMTRGRQDDAADTSLHLPEPLRSYVRALAAFETMRSHESEDDASSASAPDLAKVLSYNTSAKLTPEQCTSALALFYWAAVHEDDSTRPITREVARRSLQMYIPLGHVVLRKRAYRFTTK